MLNWADITLIAIVALSTLVGLWRGFIVEALSLAVWAVAFWVAFQFGKPVAEVFEGHIDTPSARLFLSHALLFIGALVVGGLVTWLVGRLVASTGLSGTDRLLGLVFGLVRGGALGCLLVLLLGFTPLPGDPWWRESKLLPGFQQGAEWMKSWLPDAAAQYVRFGADDLTAPRAPPGE